VLEEGRAHLGTAAARVLERVIVRARRENLHRWNAWRELLRALLSKKNSSPAPCACKLYPGFWQPRAGAHRFQGGGRTSLHAPPPP